MSKLKKGSAIGLLAVSVVGGAEGLRQNAYLDVVAVPTICYGETKGVKLGDHKTKAECDAMLLARLDEFANHVEKCVKPHMPTKTEVAFVSLAYNIGWDAFCKSSVARRYNEGDGPAACDAILMWDKAKGITWPGLTKRRERERVMCLEGWMEGRFSDAFQVTVR